MAAAEATARRRRRIVLLLLARCVKWRARRRRVYRFPTLARAMVTPGGGVDGRACEGFPAVVARNENSVTAGGAWRARRGRRRSLHTVVVVGRWTMITIIK